MFEFQANTLIMTGKEFIFVANNVLSNIVSSAVISSNSYGSGIDTMNCSHRGLIFYYFHSYYEHYQGNKRDNQYNWIAF